MKANHLSIVEGVPGRDRGAEMNNAAGIPFGDIIREYRTRKKMSQEQLGSLVHVKKNAVGAWEAGRSRPDVAGIPVLCETLGIPLYDFFGLPSAENDLFSTRFSRLSPANQRIILRQMDQLYDQQLASAVPSSRRVLPVYLNDLSAAAGPISYLDEARGETILLYADELTERANEVIRVSGDSMEPTFFDGDKVLVERTNSLRVGEIGIFLHGDAGYIKEYRKDGLYSHNPKYAPLRFPPEDSVRVYGRVLGVLSSSQIAPAPTVL